jgi:RecG-like helicase
MINLILTAIPAPVWAALASMAAIAVAWLKGWSDGRRDIETKAAAKSADDLKKAKEVHDEIDSISRDDVSERLRKWQRP